MIKKILWSGLIVFWLIGDSVTTVAMLELGFRELNPVVVWSLENGGYPLFILSKTLWLAVMGKLVQVWPKPFDNIFLLVTALTGFYATVNNLLLIAG